MRTNRVFCYLLITALLVISCRNLTIFGKNVDAITPSDNIITEQRTVSGLTGIDIRTFGRVLLTQGDSESLSIKGSDNLVALVNTSVRNGILIIEMEETINVLNADLEDLLTFTIELKDLTSLTVSGLAMVEMETLTTSDLAVTMSGAGQLQLGRFSAESVKIDLSGLGNVEIAGEVDHANIVISGAGEVSAADLKCKTAEVDIPGLGSATVWVTDQLTGTISGGGNVSYYGNPQTDTSTSGLGEFKSLGTK